MKKTFIFIALSLCLYGCSGTAPVSSSVPEPSSTISSSTSTPMSLDEMAEAQSARVGEINKPYPIRPSGGVGVISINYLPEFDVGTNVLNQMIAVEVTAGYDELKDFSSQYSTAELFKNTGEAFTDISSGVYRDTENDKIFLLFYSDTDISDYNYISIGQFEQEKNDGKTTVIFEIG